MNVNKVILLWRLGKDPEVRRLPNGDCVASISLATSETYKDKKTGERKQVTEWHLLVLWRGVAEVAEKYLGKGDLIYIEGKLKTRSWDDKEGVKRYVTEVLVNNLVMLGGKKDDSKQPSMPQSELYESENDDDLPF